MERFRNFTGIVAPLDRINVDTDQIIPKQFLKLMQRTGFGKYLFYEWRFERDGRVKADFVLNNPRFGGAKILLTRANFGCGSSREHAVWALSEYGFRTLIAPSYADIFYNNCFKNGILPIILAQADVDHLFSEVSKQEGYSLEIDLPEQTIRKPNGETIHFDIDSFRKKSLLEGPDEIALTLQLDAKIRDYEMTLSGFQLARD